jgi:hypothetical protein
MSSNKNTTFVEAAPEPVVEAAPEPVVEAAPEPVVEAAPEPVVPEAPAAPTRFLVEAKNPEYEGKTFGIRFTNGKAVVEEAILPKHLKRSFEKVIAGFRDMPGYTLTPLE